jgi:hypothetical protein
MRKSTISGRIFIVGCPRSGTTFLQAALSQHPEVLSLPETGFFDQLYDHFEGWIRGADQRPVKKRRFGYARSGAHRQARRLFTSIGEKSGVRPPLWARRWSYAGYIRSFVRMLDQAARSAGRPVWLEKTPVHIAYVDAITTHIPDAKFVHILRGGEDVIASLVDAGVSYHDRPEAGGFDRWLPLWVSYWNRSMETHLRFSGQPGHVFVRHEDLVTHFDSESLRLQRALGLTPTIERKPAKATQISDIAIEPWKAVASGARPRASARKFEQLFGPLLQRWLRERLVDYDAVVSELVGRGSLPLFARPRSRTADRAAVTQFGTKSQ